MIPFNLGKLLFNNQVVSYYHALHQDAIHFTLGLEISTIRFRHMTQRYLTRLLLIIPLFLTSCFMFQSDPLIFPTSENVRLPDAESNPQSDETNSDLPLGMRDELAVLSGICFNSAFDAREQVFVIRSAREHIDFYDLADNSELCRRPIERHPFDFTTGRILAGRWSYGFGCQAQHNILSVDKNDETKTIRIELLFITVGECDYELIRPFWVSIPDAQDYTIDIVVVNQD